tara:strand:- start:174 stop:545 length:372 start_codon:yes stop_codon:yes gene_type:complete
MNKIERPLIKNLIQEGTNEIEGFQNNTIRPIVKMQHDLLIISFKNYLKKRRIDFENYSEKQKMIQISSIFTRDIAYKNISLGSIIGHFSIEEYNFYSQNSPEIHKRIIKILQKRIQDSILQII